MTYFNYDLLPKLIYLTLVGVDDEGELEFWGTEAQWQLAAQMSIKMYG